MKISAPRPGNYQIERRELSGGVIDAFENNSDVALVALAGDDYWTGSPDFAGVNSWRKGGRFVALFWSPRLVVRFGEFTANLETGELHRNGTKLKLQSQPFEILSVLLKHPTPGYARGVAPPALAE